MSEELEVLKEVTRRLEKAAIPYMITGSMAANFYTVPLLKDVKGLNRSYLTRWAKALGVEALYREVQQ